ncbi:hypothetical protein AMAG_19495 [Allomyces macrogynus ATCC 38327]|uniref:Uncharacterized protein n=1 Tax=Allomyces macrogynus (strain ATCC 38327) TaxID=578462 RepID=A0A0L0SWH9_ALLM3|nr:hypothetical protein AMAG_19495 [Allomyces macrogynus ATCC 38327]|eukprot:KNE66699.1 hypothetical protein AMAG_19495 [Allomyces macrogynus ATCC 38327]
MVPLHPRPARGCLERAPRPGYVDDYVAQLPRPANAKRPAYAEFRVPEPPRTTMIVRQIPHTSATKSKAAAKGAATMGRHTGGRDPGQY